MDTLLKISDLSVAYRTPRQGEKLAVSGVSLAVSPGEMTAIVGESGSGKSTTAQAALGLLPKSATVLGGQITFAGRGMVGLSDRAWRDVRGTRIGYIPQDPNNSLNPTKTIGASVGEGLAIHRVGDAKARREKVVRLLDKVGIDNPDKRYDQYPHELSGGMKQRALIAAAVALEPDLIIADEPTSALDVTVQKVILDLLDEMRAELGIGILFITHDLAVAGDRADRVVVMEDGQVRESGIAAAVLTDPKAPYTKRLLANAPSLSAAPVRRPAVPANAGAPALLEVRDVTQRFGDFTAVDGVSFSVPRGSTHAIVGQSGSGKTTTGRSIAMFNRPTAGEVMFKGQDLTQASAKEIRRLHGSIQLVYQNPYSSLNPRMSIGDAVAEPARNLGRATKRQARQTAREFLELVSLDPSMYDRSPAELSGGQCQRVAIARAIVIEPELVVLDEAVSALDVTVQAQILELLDRLQRDLDLTYVFISHDLAVVNQISDTVSVLSRGRQVEVGKTADIFAHPQTDYTARLINAIPGQRYRAGDLNLGL